MKGAAAVQRSREGLSLASQVSYRLVRTRGRPRFAGVRLSAPDTVAAWGIAHQVAGGEYSFPDLTPVPGDRVIDIGANIGVYALWAARKGAVVMAYEPAPLTFRHLVANTRRRPSVTPVNAAIVGAVPPDEKIRLYLHHQWSTRNTLLGREIGSGEPLASYVDVAAIGIDAVLDVGCDVLKIDCEGAEYEILAGASDSALRRVRRLVVEFHRTAGDPQVLLDRLAAAGFDASIIDGSDPGQPFGLIGAIRAS
jgi:FkbM family methyltransferase